MPGAGLATGTDVVGARCAEACSRKKPATGAHSRRFSNSRFRACSSIWLFELNYSLAEIFLRMTSTSAGRVLSAGFRALSFWSRRRRYLLDVLLSLARVMPIESLCTICLGATALVSPMALRIESDHLVRIQDRPASRLRGRSGRLV